MSTRDVKAAADAITELSRFADRCRITSPAMTAAAVPPHERMNLLSSIAVIDAFCGRLVVILSDAPAPEVRG